MTEIAPSSLALLGVILLRPEKCTEGNKMHPIFLKLSFLVVLGCPLMGQLTSAAKNRQYWAGDTLLTHVREKWSIQTESLNPKSKTLTKLPDNMLRYCGYFNNLHSIVCKNKEKQSFEVFTSTDLKKWTSRCHIPKAKAPIGFDAIPLADGNFFLIARSFPWVINQTGSIYAVATVDDNSNLKLLKIIDPGFSKSLCTKSPTPSTPNGIDIRDEYILLSNASYEAINPIQCGDDIAVASQGSGYVLVFSGKNGDVKRNLPIFKTIREDLLAQQPIDADHAILCAFPTKDGDILFITRSEDAIEYSRKIFSRKTKMLQENEIENHKTLTNEAKIGIQFEHLKKAEKDNEKAVNLALEEFPRIEYIEFDSKNKVMSIITPPKSFPNRILKKSMLDGFIPCMNIKGELSFNKD